MERKKMMAYAIVTLMLMGMLLTSTHSRADGPIYDQESMPSLPVEESGGEPAPVPARTSSSAWEEIVTDPDEGGINVQNGYAKGDSNNLYFRMTSYNAWSTTSEVYGLIWVDADCNSSTGFAINDIGADYWIIVYGWRGYHYVYSWNGGGWTSDGQVSYLSTPNDYTMEIGVLWSDIGGVSDKQVVLGMIDTSIGQWDYAPDVGHANITLERDPFVEPEDISFSGPITASSDISITARIHNSNLWFAEKDVQVRFYMDRTSHIYHTVTIDSIPANGSATITVPWHVPSQEGSHTVKVVVDPDNIINETREDNNVAETTVIVNATAGDTTTPSESASVMGDTTTIGLIGLAMLLLIFLVVMIAIKRTKQE